MLALFFRINCAFTQRAFDKHFRVRSFSRKFLLGTKEIQKKIVKKDRWFTIDYNFTWIAPTGRSGDVHYNIPIYESVCHFVWPLPPIENVNDFSMRNDIYQIVTSGKKATKWKKHAHGKVDREAAVITFQMDGKIENINEIIELHQL